MNITFELKRKLEITPAELLTMLQIVLENSFDSKLEELRRQHPHDYVDLVGRSGVEAPITENGFHVEVWSPQPPFSIENRFTVPFTPDQLIVYAAITAVFNLTKSA